LKIGTAIDITPDVPNPEFDAATLGGWLLGENRCRELQEREYCQTCKLA